MDAKKFLEESLINILKKKSIDKIKVSEIIREVGTCKGTFYKYYCDKYDLLLSCFKNRVYNEVMKNADDWKSFTAFSLVAFSKMPSVTLNAFMSQDVNSIRKYHDNLLASYFENDLKKVKDKSAINRGITHICAYGYTEIMLTWIQTGMKESVEELISYMQAAMPQSIYTEVYALA